MHRKKLNKITLHEAHKIKVVMSKVHFSLGEVKNTHTQTNYIWGVKKGHTNWPGRERGREGGSVRDTKTLTINSKTGWQKQSLPKQMNLFVWNKHTHSLADPIQLLHPNPQANLAGVCLSLSLSLSLFRTVYHRCVFFFSFPSLFCCVNNSLLHLPFIAERERERDRGNRLPFNWQMKGKQQQKRKSAGDRHQRRKQGHCTFRVTPGENWTRDLKINSVLYDVERARFLGKKCYRTTTTKKTMSTLHGQSILACRQWIQPGSFSIEKARGNFEWRRF